jgi:hypothetical protein
MRRLPSIAPSLPDDVDVYLVLDDFGERMGRAWRETDEERVDRETVIADLLEGQYSDPVRVVAFNTAEGWSRDVSQDIAGSAIAWHSKTERQRPRSKASSIDTSAADRRSCPCRSEALPEAYRSIGPRSL